MCSRQRMPRAIFAGRPVHRLLRYVYGAHKSHVACGTQEEAAAELAASKHGGPAVYLGDIKLWENEQCGDKGQRGSDEDALHNVRSNGSRVGYMEENPQRSKKERYDDYGNDDVKQDGAVHRDIYSTSLLD